MPRQENAVGNGKTGIMRGQTSGHRLPLQPTSDFPEIGKERLANRGRQVRGAARRSRTWLHPDRTFHHLYVTIAPFLHTLVEIDETFAQLGVLRVAAINVDEYLLHF